MNRAWVLRARAAMAARAAALAGLGLSVPALAGAACQAETEAGSGDRAAGGCGRASEAAARVAGWVATSGDNGELPYIIIDKQAAELFMFDARGKRLGDAPVLIGVAAGDEATPGIGSKKLAEIGPAERTTPAGRFIARFGRAAARQRVLWVDYHTLVRAARGGDQQQEGAPERARAGLARGRRTNRTTSSAASTCPATCSTARPSARFVPEGGGVVYVLPDEASRSRRSFRDCGPSRIANAAVQVPQAGG